MKLLNKKVIMFIAFIIICFIYAPSSVHASSEKTYSGKVIATTLNVRSSPSQSNDILGQLKKNDSVQIYESKNGWYKIKLKNGFGYVNSNYVSSNLSASKDTSTTTNTKSTTAIVNTLALKLRSGPSATYDSLQTLHKNDLVTVVGEKNSWSQIKINNKTGWVSSLYLTKGKVTKPSSNTSKKTIVLDAGHGGYDCGAIGPKGTKEANVNLSVTLKLGSILKAQGYNVIYTRTSNTVPWKANKDIELQTRVNIANKANADLFVSIHSNSSDNSSVYGLESYYYNSNSKSLAQSIQKATLNNINLKDRGIRTAPYYVLRKTNTASVLVELGYISNATEEGKLNSSSYQQKWAKGIAEGINNYFKK